MRRIRYAVASSLDGFIAGPDGEADWIVMDPEFDFQEVFQQFDTLLVGRKTFEPMAAAGRSSMPGMQTIVFSNTLQPSDYPDVTFVQHDGFKMLRELKTQPGKDIWLFGGSALFASLANENLVDSVEVAIMPVLLSSGTPLSPPETGTIKLRLLHQRTFSTGAISLEYAIEPNKDS